MRKGSLFHLGLLLGLLLIALPVRAQQSWIWSRSDLSREINLDTDSISMVLLESRVPSGDNFLAKDNQVGLLIQTDFTGKTALEPSASRQFPFMFLHTAEALADPSHKKSKNLAKQEILVNYFPLTEGKTVYRGVTVDVKLLRKQEKAGWTKVMDTLLSATNAITLPSPLSVGVTYLNKFSTDVLNQYLPNPDKQKRIDLGSLSFLVSKTPGELNRIAFTGLYLKVLQPTGTGPGWVDPSDWANHCFYTKFEGTNWTVFVARKDSTANDKDTAGCSQSKYARLMNDYVPILIEAQQTAKPNPSLLKEMMGVESFTEDDALQRFNKRAEDMREAAAAQCKAYQIKPEKCPVLKSQ